MSKMQFGIGMYMTVTETEKRECRITLIIRLNMASSVIDLHTHNMQFSQITRTCLAIGMFVSVQVNLCIITFHFLLVLF